MTVVTKMRLSWGTGYIGTNLPSQKVRPLGRATSWTPTKCCLSDVPGSLLLTAKLWLSAFFREMGSMVPKMAFGSYLIHMAFSRFAVNSSALVPKWGCFSNGLRS